MIIIPIDRIKIFLIETIIKMLSRVLRFYFSTDVVFSYRHRNTRSSFWGTEKVSGTKKTDSLVGQTCASPQEVSFPSFRYPGSHQCWKNSQAKRLRIRYLLYFSTYSCHSNLQLRRRRNWLPLHPCYQGLAPQWTTLWSLTGTQQNGNRRETR